MAVHVVNEWVHIPTPYDYYVGRPCLLGNPFVYSTDKERVVAVNRYRKYILKVFEASPGVVRDTILDLARIALEEPVNLVCWCAPLPCHGYPLKDLVERVALSYRVLVSGSRSWTNRMIVHECLRDLPKQSIVIHGGAKGLDTIAGEVARSLGHLVLRYPADWEQHRLAAGPIRNQQMLDNAQPHELIAFHNDLKNSKGTKDMVQRAKAQGLLFSVVCDSTT